MRVHQAGHRMGVLEAAARIVELGGTERRAGRAVEIRAAFEARTGAFAPDDPWFEERSRAFWCDAVTLGRFGREVEQELSADERAWLEPLERAHRGLFRRTATAPTRSAGPKGEILLDVWNGAELAITTLDDASRAELDAAAGQFLDARIVGGQEDSGRPVVALLPGAIFHPRHATEAIEAVVETARSRSMSTHDALDALLRMERALRALSRVKAAYAYRAEALSAQASNVSPVTVRRAAKAPR